jgi:hypothetical protein
VISIVGHTDSLQAITPTKVEKKNLTCTIIRDIEIQFWLDVLRFLRHFVQISKARSRIESLSKELKAICTLTSGASHAPRDVTLIKHQSTLFRFITNIYSFGTAPSFLSLYFPLSSLPHPKSRVQTLIKCHRHCRTMNFDRSITPECAS